MSLECGFCLLVLSVLPGMLWVWKTRERSQLSLCFKHLTWSLARCASKLLLDQNPLSDLNWSSFLLSLFLPFWFHIGSSKLINPPLPSIIPLLKILLWLLLTLKMEIQFPGPGPYHWPRLHEACLILPLPHHTAYQSTPRDLSHFLAPCTDSHFFFWCVISVSGIKIQLSCHHPCKAFPTFPRKVVPSAGFADDCPVSTLLGFYYPVSLCIAPITLRTRNGA